MSVDIGGLKIISRVKNSIGERELLEDKKEIRKIRYKIFPNSCLTS